MLSLIYRSLETIEDIIKVSLFKQYNVVLPRNDIIITLQMYNKEIFIYCTTNGSSTLEFSLFALSNVDEHMNADICLKVQTSQDFNHNDYPPELVSCYDDDMYYIVIDAGPHFVKEVMNIKKIINSINKVPMIEV
jgi:hypothetical protein